MADDRRLEASQPEEVADDAATPGEKLARRKLLKMVYIAPAVIGTVLISGNANAEVPLSCPPYANPCNPPPPCNPRPPPLQTPTDTTIQTPTPTYRTRRR